MDVRSLLCMRGQFILLCLEALGHLKQWQGGKENGSNVMSSSLPLILAAAFLRVFACPHLLCYPPSLLSCLERVETLDDRCRLPTMEIIHVTVTKVWHYDLILGFSAFWNSLQFTYLPKISEAQFIYFLISSSFYFQL